MFTLPLSDPLWRKLDDAHRDRDIPELLQRLSREWDTQTAKSLFWDCLCHQDTCYGATYASVPHLLKIANNPPAPEAVSQIAGFLGHVSLVAFEEGEPAGQNVALQGLPQDIEGWDKKLETFRALAAHARRDLNARDAPKTDVRPRDLEQARRFVEALTQGLSTRDSANTLDEELLGAGSFPTRDSRTADLERNEELLSRPAINNGDLAIIARIRDNFLDSQAAIKALCLQAYAQATDPAERPFLLSGALAAMGDRRLGLQMENYDACSFNCRSCGWHHQMIMQGAQLACYASYAGPDVDYCEYGDDPMLQDVRQGSLSRADGFVDACKEFDAGSPRAAVLGAVRAHGDHLNELRLKLFGGSYTCGKCGSVTPVA